MRKLVFFLALGLGANCAYAQNAKNGEEANEQKVKESDLPAAVKTTFKKNYPQIKDSKWEKEGANYETEFEVNKTETSVVIDGAGKILETETEIAVSALPKAISQYVSKNISGKKIEEASKITDYTGKISYEVELGGKDYIFDAKGNLIKVDKE